MKRLSLSFLLLSLAAVGLHAQDERPRLNPAIVPATGNAPGAFVPRGWMVEETLRGDLNKDKRPDVVLSLIEDLPGENSEGTPNTRLRAIVVLFAQADGSLKRAAVAPAVLYCTTCGGVLSAGTASGGMMRIEKGVLVTDQLSGSREAVNRVQRFRWDEAKGTMMMIGQDIIAYDRVDGGSETTSINYLTGVMTYEKVAYNRKRETTRVIKKEKRRNRALRPVPIETFDFEADLL